MKEKNNLETDLQTAAGHCLGSGRTLLGLQKEIVQFLCHGTEQKLGCDQS
jgi:hypothetical protein